MPPVKIKIQGSKHLKSSVGNGLLTRVSSKGTSMNDHDGCLSSGSSESSHSPCRLTWLFEATLFTLV